MKRLELIVSGDTPTQEELREHLDAYIEGFVDDELRQHIERALADDPDLKAEHDALKQTMSLLHQADRPAPPVDMVARVRAKLADDTSQVAPMDDGTPDNVVSLAQRRWWTRPLLFAASASVAAAAALFVVVGLPQLADGGAQGVAAAGLSLGARAATITVSDVAAADVEMLASESGLEMVDGTMVFEGTGPDVARFVFKLRSDKQADVRGFVPEGQRIRLTVKLQP